MSERAFVYSIPKNSREEIRVSLCEYNGYRGVDIRVCVPSEEGDEVRPTRKGVWVPVAQLSKLLEAVQAIMEARPAA